MAGHAVCDEGVMIDLTLMRSVKVDAERRLAIAEGGALWRDVDAASQAHGLATPGGKTFASLEAARQKLGQDMARWALGYGDPLRGD